MKQETPVSLRRATREDAPFLALALMEAMGGQVMERQEAGSLTAEDRRRHAILAAICGRDDTLYTWLHGTIAQTGDGVAVGAAIAYPGAEYHRRRLVTFSLARAMVSFDTESMEDESEAGELYLDTLAVLPAWRRRGVARALMGDWLQRADETGLTATLARARGNLRARLLYESMGLSDTRLVFIFGEHYQKMARPRAAAAQ